MPKYTDADMTPQLIARAISNLEAYAGENPFLVNVRTGLTRYGRLSVKQARAVLNALATDRHYTVAQAFEINDYMPYGETTVKATTVVLPDGRPSETEFGPIDWTSDGVKCALAHCDGKIDYEWLSVQSYATPEERGHMSDQLMELRQARYDIMMFQDGRGKRASEYFNNARARQVMGIVR